MLYKKRQPWYIKNKPTTKNLPCLPAPVYVAQEMGERLGAGDLLFGVVSAQLY